MVAQVCTILTLQALHTTGHDGQVFLHSQDMIPVIDPGQTGQDIIGCRIDTVAKAVRDQCSIRLLGGEQMAHVHRRFLGPDGKRAVILAEPVLCILQIHQVIQFLEGGITVFVVILHRTNTIGHFRPAAHNIRQKEVAHDVVPAFQTQILQHLPDDIAGINEAAAARSTGKARKHIHINGGICAHQRSRALLLDPDFEGSRLAQQQETPHLAHTDCTLGTQQTENLVCFHPAHHRIVEDRTVVLQDSLQVRHGDGEILIIGQTSRALESAHCGFIRVDGQELDVLIPRSRAVRVIRLQLLEHLALELCQRRNAGAANADAERRTAKLLRFLGGTDNTTAVVQ